MVKDKEFDFSQTMQHDAAEAPVITEEGLSSISAISVRLLERTASLEELQEQSKQLREEIESISTKDLPDAMAEYGVAEFTMETGEKITVKDEVHASISKKNLVAAHKWLEDNNFDGLIKTDVVIKFGKDEHDRFVELKALLSEEGYGEDYSSKEAVHAGTLKAFIREQMAKPIEDPTKVEIPVDLFSLYEVRRAIVK